MNAILSLMKPRKKLASPAVPDGERIYAIGDIHGRADLFGTMIEAIDQREKKLKKAKVTVILLGDLVDRGPDSAGVVEKARKWTKRCNVRILCGNHEEMFQRSFTEKKVLRHFLRFGGKQTLRSYGIKKKFLETAKMSEIQEQMAECVPEKHRKFMASFEDYVAIGDYVFVHAGIDPHMPLTGQVARDLRWIREPFLSHRKNFGAIVVHGHTITEKAEVKPNRIGIDTGAYNSGRLTALVLEGTGRHYIEAREKKGALSTHITKG